MKKYTRGFTLIELLVVIAIIGILASVVLVSLSSARQKGADSKMIQQLGQARASAEIYYSSNNSYGTTVSSCTSGMFSDTLSGMSQTLAAISGTKDCGASATAYSIAAQLGTSGQYWCIDSLGKSKNTQGTGSTLYTALTGAATAAHTAAGATVCN